MTNKCVLITAAMPYYCEKGSTLRTHRMVEKYLKEGYEVELLCYKTGENIDKEGLNINRSGIRSIETSDPGPSLQNVPSDFLMLLSAVKKSIFNDYDKIQGEDVEGGFIGLIASKLSQTEFIYDLHNPLSDGLRIYGWNFLLPIADSTENLLYSNSEKIISNWRIWEQSIKEKYPDKNIETIHDQLPNNLEEVKLPDNDYIIYSGNFKDYQGVELLIEAFSKVKDELNCNLVLVGEPTKEIKQKASSCNLESSIIFEGRKTVEETNYLIKNSKGCVIPRKKGNQPSTKLLHYTMWDKPIIATNLECNQELDQFENKTIWCRPNVESVKDSLLELSEQNE